MYHPHVGGSELVVRELSERLAARGHQVTVATGWHPARRRDELNGVRIRQFRISGNLGTGIRGDVDAYKSFLLGADVDVMLNYAAQIWSTDLCFPLLDRLPFPRVMVPCGYTFGVPHLRDYHATLPQHLAKYDALIYMSPNYQDKRFGDMHGLGDKAVIIPNGASQEEFAKETPSFRKAFGIEKPFLILSVANHHRTKGHIDLIRTFRRLGRDDVTLVLIGERLARPWGGCYPFCRAVSLISKDIRVIENATRDVVVSAYKAADVFALASKVECSPLVIYEAMAAGTPFVALLAGDVRDHQEAGLVVDHPDGLGPAINELLEGADLRQRLGSAGREKWLRGHTWEQITDRYEKLYAQLVS